MTTLEKLFVQIFERRDWIIEQVHRQADSYTEQLASRLLIDGFTPPPSLLNPRINAHPSDPHELKKEEIISKLLLRPPRGSFSYSTGGHSLYYRPVIPGGNGHLSNEMCMETHAPNKGLNPTNEPSTTLVRPNDDRGCTLNRVTEHDDSANSPQNETDARISSIYAAPDASLARIQRSKSRQKARELRSNVKTSAKSCLSDANRVHISFTGDTMSKSDIHQVTQDNPPSELGIAAAEGKGDHGNGRISYSGRLARSSSSKEKPSFLNDHSRTSLPHNEELDGGIVVQPIDDSLQQSGHDNDVMEGVNLPDISYAAEKSVSGMRHDAERQSKGYSGRITRSRDSSQQISGTNKSLKLGTSVSYNSKEGSGAHPHSVGDLMHKLNASNKLLDSHTIGEAQAICSNKESAHAEIVAGNGPIDASVAMQPANSGVKLDNVTVCMESEGLAIKQSSEDCMVVKPKQLNFDEINSPHSNKRKLDGFLGQECNPSNDPASLDHKSPMASVLSSNSKAAMTHSFDECAHDEPMNVEHISKVSLHDDAAVLCEVSISPEEIHNNSVSKDTKQGDKDSEDKEVMISEDIGCSKSKEFEDGANSDMSNMRLNSAKFNTWPRDQQKDVENQRTCFSDSQGFRVHIQGDAIHCELESSENDLNAPQSVSIQRHDGMSCDSPEGDVEDQRTCSSDSRGFRVQIQGDANLCELESSESDLNVPQSVSTQRHDEMPCDLPEGDVEDQITGLSDSRGFRVQSQGDAIHCELESSESDLNAPQSVSIQRHDGMSCDLAEGDVEDQRTCSSDSRGFRVQIQGDANLCELESSENDLNMPQSASIQRHDGMPCDLPEGDVEDQITGLSETRGFRVQSQGDAIHCELESSENDLHVPQSDGIQRHDKMICDLEEGTESLHELEAAETTLTEVDDDPLNLIKSAPDDSTYSMPEDVRAKDQTMNDDVSPEGVSYLRDGYESVQSPQNDNDKINLEYEGFNIDDEMENHESGINFETLGIPSSTIERASMLTPLTEFSSTFKQHEVQEFYRPLEDMDKGNSVSLVEDFRNHLAPSGFGIPEVDYSFPKQQSFDSVSFSGTPIYLQSKPHYSSPVGKFWEWSGSSSGSSGKRLSSNPELTCFPIVEDPDTNEESENADAASDELQENISEKEMEIITENDNEVVDEEEMEIITENDGEVAVEIEEGIVPKPANEFAERMTYRDRCSSNSVNIEVNIPRTYDKVKYKSKFHRGIKSNKYEEENRYSSASTCASVRRNASFQTENSKNRSGMKSRIQRPSQKEGKLRNNIVSNITSFVPIVQQKQAAAVCPVKRDVKVKALEAAEAAKIREQEKEKERKMKKEALKLARARVEEENAKEMELNKKKKQEEQKKKEADMAARKRQKEEDERKQMAKKRKFAEARKEQKVQSEKSRGGKQELEKRNGKRVGIGSNKKGSSNVTEHLRQIRNACEALQSVVQSVPESYDSGDKEKASSIGEKSPGHIGSVRLIHEENSYEISPYKCSDDEDEDEDEDDLPTEKFIPSWASKMAVAMVLPLQQEVDPEKIFSIETFCSMNEVLPPRRPQLPMSHAN